MLSVRLFEFFVMTLVLGVAVCFCIQLSFIHNASVADVFRGYLPSAAVVKGNGIYLSCGILGATVMPHSLYLGSEICQPRLRLFEAVERSATVPAPPNTSEHGAPTSPLRPRISSIRTCLRYSIVELTLSLFTFALFINSAILIIAGSALYGTEGAADASLFSIHGLLSRTLTPAAGTVFALALLLSGLSAGIVCTMAGQIVSDGFLRWTLKPWVRRLITRGISILPSIVIAGAIGREGLDTALVASQVVLSVILPIVTSPLIYFTCQRSVMSIPDDTPDPGVVAHGAGDVGVADAVAGADEHGTPPPRMVDMKNGPVVALLAIAIWLVLVVMNVALLVLLGLGKT